MKNPRSEEGLRIRQAVLGKERVDKKMAETDDFSQPFQDLVLEYCWGNIWARPGLPLKTRSLLNLGILTALNRPQQYKTHLRGAINNGCTREEIREVLMQTAIYCGVPAASDAFRIAQETLAELKKEGK